MPSARPVPPVRPVRRRASFAAGCLMLLLGTPARAEDPARELPAIRRLLRDPLPSARAAAYRRLTGSADPAVVQVLVEGLGDAHPYVRRAVAGVLGTLSDPRTRLKLAQEAPRWRLEAARRELCQAYSLWLDDTGLKGLLAATQDRAPSVRVEALRWLADDPAPQAGEALRTLTTDPDPWVKAEALDALTPRLAHGSIGEGLDTQGALGDADPRVRLAALELTVALGGVARVPAVIAALTDASWSVRLVAAGHAGRLRDRRVLEPLVAALSDPRLRVGEAAGRALVALTGIPFDPEVKPWRAWLDGPGRTFDPAQAPETTLPSPPPPPPGSRTVETRFLGVPLRSRHLAFVLDGSGSMAARLADGRTRWEEVATELERAVTGLTGAHVNLAVFDETVEPAFPRALPLDAGRRETLLRFVRARGPSGKTALYDGIAWGLSDPDVDTLVVLSDGAPSAGAFFTKSDLLAELRRANRFRRARIDVIAVGADAVAQRWRDALRQITEETGGTYVAR